jgi:hypothetical protein
VVYRALTVAEHPRPECDTRHDVPYLVVETCRKVSESS